jgi:hypothetical protein
VVADTLSRSPTPQGTDPHQPTAKISALPPDPFTNVAQDWPKEDLAAPELTQTLETIITANRSGVVPAKQPPTVSAPKPQVLDAVDDAQPVDFLAMAA